MVASVAAVVSVVASVIAAVVATVIATIVAVVAAVVATGISALCAIVVIHRRKAHGKEVSVIVSVCHISNNELRSNAQVLTVHGCHYRGP